MIEVIVIQLDYNMSYFFPVYFRIFYLSSTLNHSLTNKKNDILCNFMTLEKSTLLN